MKKNYVTPMIAVEHYELTQSIASCATKIGFLDDGCVKNDPDASKKMKELAWSGYFMEAGDCTIWATSMDKDDSMCYHTNINQAFNS